MIDRDPAIGAHRGRPPAGEEWLSGLVSMLFGLALKMFSGGRSGRVAVRHRWC